MKVKLFTAPTEIDASIIKGVLSEEEVPALIALAKENMTLVHIITGPNVPHDVFVEDDMVEKASAILKENGWIKQD